MQKYMLVTFVLILISLSATSSSSEETAKTERKCL